MPLSSDSLFHYTYGGMPILTKILSEGFKVSYSFEYPLTYYSNRGPSNSLCVIKPSYFNNDGNAGLNYLYIPMVSFCDIPISNIKAHLDNYGYKDGSIVRAYAIGLTKSWGLKFDLNQVLYVIPGSSIAKNFSRLYKRNDTFYKDTDQAKINTGQYGIEQYVPPVHYKLKDGLVNDNKGNLYPYESLFLKPICEIKKDGPDDPLKKTLFIDEKEWRYVPENACILSGYKFLSTSHNQTYYRSIAENTERAISEVGDGYDRLTFEIDDITHIVVGLDNEIPEIQKHLKLEFKDKRGVSDDELYLLYSKVTSYETLKRDFFSH